MPLAYKSVEQDEACFDKKQIKGDKENNTVIDLLLTLLGHFLTSFLERDEMKTTTVTTSAFLLSALMFSTVQAQNVSSHQFFKPNELKWADVPSLPPGAKVAVMEGPLSEAKPFTIRLQLPANYKIPPHSHTSMEHVTVISGTFNLGMGEQFDQAKTHALSAGDFAIMQPGTVHFGSTTEPTIVQVHGVGPWVVNYVNPKDDPRKK